MNIIDSIMDGKSGYSYEIFCELAIIFATKMDETYKNQFFDKLMEKFIGDMKYLDDTTLYKMLYSFIRAGKFQEEKDAYEWLRIREIIKGKAKTIDP